MNKQNFHTISKEEIYKFIENHNSDVWESVCNIQNIKEDMIKRISKELWDNNVKFIDPRLINGVEKDYFELLKKSEWDINKDFDYTKQKNEFEKMFKTHEFDEIYIKNFDDIRKSHMIETPKNKLIKKLIYYNCPNCLNFSGKYVSTTYSSPYLEKDCCSAFLPILSIFLISFCQNSLLYLGSLASSLSLITSTSLSLSVGKS